MRSLAPLVLLLCLLPTEGTAQSTPPSSALPGACVAIPHTRLHVHRHVRQASPPDPSLPHFVDDTVSPGSVDVDLDGDGTLDTLSPVPVDGDCWDTMHLAIYVARGTCGHELGVIRGRLAFDAIATAPRAHGLPELRTTVEETLQPDPRIPAQRRTHTFVYRFDGRRYVEASHTFVDATCHHCALVRCQTEPMQ